MIVPNALKPLRLALAAAALVPAVTAAPAAAPTPAQAIVARQAAFKKMGGAMKALGAQLKSGAPVQATMLAAAQTLAATAPTPGSLFPAGSGASAGVKTAALANIWSDRATFDAQMKKMIAETGKLAAVVKGGDTAAINAQFKVTGGACGACHRQFRAGD